VSKAERDSRYTKSRRARGLCGKGGCPRRSGDAYYCKSHKADAAAKQQARRDARRALKLAVAA
jgi:hypothetical protein